MTVLVESEKLPIVAGVELRIVQKVEYESGRTRSIA